LKAITVTFNLDDRVYASTVAAQTAANLDSDTWWTMVIQPLLRNTFTLYPSDDIRQLITAAAQAEQAKSEAIEAALQIAVMQQAQTQPPQ